MTQLRVDSPIKIDIQRVLRGTPLPALPQSAIRLMELSQDEENGPAEFAVPIEADAGLTGQVLKFVNSSYFGFSREISSVKLAITLVGIRTIKNFALWSAVFSLMPNPKCGPFDLKRLWQDSLRRALFARAMGRLLGLKDAEEPFAAALLQDMAVPLLAREFPKEYVELLEARHGGQARLSQLERDRFGWTHAEVAGAIARSWKLPEEFAMLVEQHTDLEEALARPQQRPDELAVCLSALLPTSADPTWVDFLQFEQCYQRLRPAQGPALPALLGQIDREFAEFAPVLRVSNPTKSLVDSYQEAAAVADAV
jgi:HD-like signal output (HDOD) protein